MFIKINPSKNFKYVQIVESYRKEGKVKHRIVFNLGRLDQLENNPSFQKMGTKLAQLAGASTLNLEECSEAQMFNWGYLVYKKLWEQFKLPELLTSIKNQGKSQFDFNSACFLMAIQHLLSPQSKFSTYQKQVHYAKLTQVELNHLYRSLDILSESKELIEGHLFKMNRDLFNMKIDVVFYDVTTFHFESIQADHLKNFGFSKNAKFNEVQVVLGLLVDCEGRPIGYELFPGNTFEGKTLEKALESLEKRFGIRRVIVVADRGLNSKINLKRIKDKGYGYIVASRLKKMGKEIQEKILKSDDFEILTENEEGVIKYKTLDYINRFKLEKDNPSNSTKKIYQTIELEEKLIITYSSKRARKDALDRERLLEKANFLLEQPSRIKSSNKRGGKKYIEEKNKAQWELNSAAVERDKMWDGYYGIQTSEKEISTQAAVEAHHTLWKIEESFRILKSTLETRPIFHWTEKRIKGHFMICFIAFLLERTLEIKLKKPDLISSPTKIREALNSMQFAQVNIAGNDFYIKTQSTPLASAILRQLKIQPPKNLIAVADFLN